jgi:hypothetical protein
MVLGLVGVVGFFLVVPLLVCPLAWYYGAVADRETEREPTRYREGSEARTGMVMGIVGSAMLTLFLFLLFVVGALTLLSSHYDAGYGT